MENKSFGGPNFIHSMSKKASSQFQDRELGVVGVDGKRGTAVRFGGAMRN